MRGLPKIRRKGDDQPTSEQPTQVAPAISPDDQPTIAYSEPLVPPPGEPPTAEQTAIVTPPPADLDPAAMQVAPAPSFRDRGRLRRRLAYLRRVRELGFRDLGGLVFDLHRFQRPGRQLVDAKLNALAIVDRELRALERVLKDKPLYIDLREPGIAACPRCAALHGSDARFCPSCGIKLSGPLGIGEVGGVPAPPPPPGPATGAPGSVSTAQYGGTPVSAGVPEAPAAEPVAPEPPPQPEPPAPEAPTQPEPPAPEVPVEPEPEAAAEPQPPATKGRGRRGRSKAKAAPEPEAAEPAAAEPEEPEPPAAEPEPNAPQATEPELPTAEPEPPAAEPEPPAAEPGDSANPWTPPGLEPRS